jgi:hypothetical protein
MREPSEEPMRFEFRGEGRSLPACEVAPRAPLDPDDRKARIVQAITRSLRRRRPDRPRSMVGRTPFRRAAGPLLEEEAPAESPELGQGQGDGWRG